ALFFVLVSPRFALVLPALLMLFFAVSTEPVDERTRAASIGALFQGITRPERDWVDRAVDGKVAAIWTGRNDSLTVLENEFFSRAVGPVFTLAGPLPGGLAQTPLSPDVDTGALLEETGRGAAVQYALVDDSVPLAGAIAGRDARKGLRIVRVAGPLRLTHQVTGVYGDGWSGASVVYRRYECTGGSVLVTTESDPNLFRRSQIVRALAGNRVLARGRIPRDGVGQLRVPLEPERGVCAVRLVVSPTVVPGGGDSRRLGTHFRSFAFSS
ncbi:MAG: hypothetical protein ACRDN6_02555, partial [Gaiellaceae bacterium]